MAPSIPNGNVSLEEGERTDTGGRGWRRQLGLWFGGEAVNERVETTLVFPVSAAEAWERIAKHEETPPKLPWMLRLVLGKVVKVEGHGSYVGALVRYVHGHGEVVKHITALDWPHHICFDVMGQRLGIEDSVVVRDGSYRIDERGTGCSVTLTTRYTAFLHPRWLWRRVEHRLLGKMQRNILKAMRSGEKRKSRGVAAARAGSGL